MAYACQIRSDSINTHDDRLTTFQVTYPRFVHAELMTHRLFSRNAASSRAIPVDKMIAQLENDPAGPVWWGKNQSGMQAREELSPYERGEAKYIWITARLEAIESAKRLHAAGVHKQIVNRLLEPWMWITVIISATHYGNFFNLRCDPNAQPEIRQIAEMMAAEYERTIPCRLMPGEWHLPFIGFPGDETLTTAEKLEVAVGRCARVSYLTHDGIRDPQADIDLCRRLAQSGHWSPFEHVARAMLQSDWVGNFHGWRQYRKDFKGEHRRVWWGLKATA